MTLAPAFSPPTTVIHLASAFLTVNAVGPARHAHRAAVNAPTKSTSSLLQSSQGTCARTVPSLAARRVLEPIPVCKQLSTIHVDATQQEGPGLSTASQSGTPELTDPTPRTNRGRRGWAVAVVMLFALLVLLAVIDRVTVVIAQRRLAARIEATQR
jgi:hypothetical protein